jgi:hypothetical protein
LEATADNAALLNYVPHVGRQAPTAGLSAVFGQNKLSFGEFGQNKLSAVGQFLDKINCPLTRCTDYPAFAPGLSVRGADQNTIMAG